MRKIGFIGYGLRSETMMKAFRALDADITVAAVADPRAAALKEELRADARFADAVYYDGPACGDELLAGGSLDGVFIGTRCSSHTPLACKVLAAGLPLFLEKPVAISRAQFEQLRGAARGREDCVTVSFPLRLSQICRELRGIVESGSLGRITMVQAINNVPYGSVYYHSWYRDPAETGGLFLQKTTHDIDYIRYLVGCDPIEVFAKTTKLYYKGDKPAGLTCPHCADYHTCTESSYVVGRQWKDEVQGDCCCFAQDTGNEDTAAAIFTFEEGFLVTYSQNFIAKKGAARRGCRIIGTEGSAEFDFYSGEIREDRYRTPQTVLHKFDAAKGAHFGGDEALALDFLAVLEGKKGRCGLKSGLMSAAACLAAKSSAEQGRAVAVDYAATLAPAVKPLAK